jgi:uncharacterized protein YkwD
MPFVRQLKSRHVFAGAIAVAAVLLVAGLAASTRPALALASCTVSDNTFDAQEQEFLRLINQYRAQNGLPTLTASVNLNRSASWMARDLAVNRYFSHTDSLGRSPSTRVADCGGQPYVGENLAAGTYKDTAAEAFDMWRASSGHNANMLNSSYRQIGIARYYDASAPYRWYWATDFSTSDDGTNASTAGAGSSGSGSTPTTSPTATPSSTPASASTSPIAVMTSPTMGSILNTSTTFRWAPGSDSRGYYFYMGTSRGSNNMVSVNMGTATGLTINGLPRIGWTVYVGLWSLTSSGWKYTDYTYQLPQ